MRLVRVPHSVIEQSYRQLAACGDGKRECVVYWIANLDEPDVVRRVLHPLHHSGTFGYEVDSDFVNRLFLDLRRDRETVRVQVHTHPQEASHSRVDDRFALAPSTGFLSLVIPDFASGRADLRGSHLVEMDRGGEWKEVDARSTLAVA